MLWRELENLRDFIGGEQFFKVKWHGILRLVRHRYGIEWFDAATYTHLSLETSIQT
jgi:hypothetical protein